MRVAVNLSAVQFEAPDLLQSVVAVLEQTGLPPEMLELEVTESMVMSDTQASTATLNALLDHGVHVALDDFGTGYSSLSYLKRMPLTHLKIDRSFVSGLPHDRENHAIVAAILAMADSLGMKVTAEGVETAEQARLLRRTTCHSLQGYLFGRPVPVAELPGVLQASERLRGDIAVGT